MDNSTREVKHLDEAWEFKGELYPTEIQAKRAAHYHYWWLHSRWGFYIGITLGFLIGMVLGHMLLAARPV